LAPRASPRLMVSWLLSAEQRTAHVKRDHRPHQSPRASPRLL